MKARSKPSRKRLETPFAKNLALILAERGLSQRAVAEICNLNPAIINGWLAGAQPHDLIAVQKLARALGCSFEWLLTGQYSELETKKLGLGEIFDIENDPSFSGLFMIEAKRLKKKVQE